ncbi:hypothetical protein CEXT_367951 [Caerostris extrusa]|uniref:Uncharacterized protein n=1 Tax=Caerostris extrusa TaxID=172846 RepID=A0AAV4RKC8_CAEEX|nr:hypothetical protein CEXT_367951 [Caerostris extrusa]
MVSGGRQALVFLLKSIEKSDGIWRKASLGIPPQVHRKIVQAYGYIVTIPVDIVANQRLPKEACYSIDRF